MYAQAPEQARIPGNRAAFFLYLLRVCIAGRHACFSMDEKTGAFDPPGIATMPSDGEAHTPLCVNAFPTYEATAPPARQNKLSR
jgi:hypothetical protein